MLLVQSDTHLYYEAAKSCWRCLRVASDLLGLQAVDPILSAQWAPDGSSILCHTALRILTVAGESGAVRHIKFPDLESRHTEHIHLVHYNPDSRCLAALTDIFLVMLPACARAAAESYWYLRYLCPHHPSLLAWNSLGAKLTVVRGGGCFSHPFSMCQPAGMKASCMAAALKDACCAASAANSHLICC